ncbi:MAG TPA: VOC family protein [Ilumatobacteraceae bacterium]|nr:VOC family protein [Ilumatobacteraceae bacterium]
MTRVPLPFGYHSVNPYIVVDDADAFITFLVETFDGREQGREVSSAGVIEHADVIIGDSLVMISEASERYPARPCVHFVYVDDVDRVFARAVSHGASALRAPEDQPWGDRVGGIVDSFRNRWWIATHMREFS